VSIPVQIAAYAIGLPALVAGSILVVAWQLEGRWALDRSYGAALALGIGYIVGHIATLGSPAFPPVEATQWLVYIALASLVIGVLETKWREIRWLTWAVRTGLLTVMSWLLLRPLIAYSWTTLQSGAWIAGLLVGALALWVTVERLIRHALPRRVGALMILWGTAQSIAIVMSQSAVLAQLQGTLTATLGAVFAVAWVFPKAKVSFVSGVPVIAMLFVAHASGGFFYAELPTWSVACLGLAPLFALLAWRISDDAMMKATGFVGAIAACTAAVWIAMLHAP